MQRPSLGRKDKRNLIRIAVSLVAFLIILAADKIVNLSEVFDSKVGWLFPFFLYFSVYLVIGYDVILKAAKNIFHGQIFDENFLMCVATFGAFALGIYSGISNKPIEGFDEALAVLLFYQVGEFFQSYATKKSRKSIAELMDIRPDYANALRNGEILTVSPEEIAVDEIIVINPGEKIPLDGVIVKGSSTLDTKALTGESLPRDVKEGDEVISGAVNLSTQIEVKVSKVFYDSTVSKILELVENASGKKSKAENFITRFSRYYTPAVVISAILIALIPGFITGDFLTWVYRALCFLVVSCPCALVVSVPLSFFAGIGAASKHGILIKGSNYLELLNKANLFVFDKTGTLTKGNFAVTTISPENRKEEILRLAAIAERNSNHPIAKSITALYGKEEENGYILTNSSGAGVVAKKDCDVILCGNEKLMKDNEISFNLQEGVGTVVYVAHNGEYIGSLLISDEIKEDALFTVPELNGMGAKTVMLTGDNETAAKSVAEKLALTDYKASLLPQDKVEAVEKMLAKKGRKDTLCFVGDGINDAPVLMRSDLGIAMGGVGSDAAIEASDVVLMKDDLRGIPLAKKISKKTMAVVFENIVVSIAVKIAVMVLSALGITNMWIAVIGDVGVAIAAIINAMRVNKKYSLKKKTEKA